MKLKRDWAILGSFWLLGLGCDRLWFFLDNSVPAWDQADYLNGAMNYWKALQSPLWFDGSWWESLWLLSSKIPPGTYLASVPFLNFFGTSEDAATLLLSLFSAILLVAVYALGKILFGSTVGLWAAGICQILPGLYRYRTEFLLDYPLAAMVTSCFALLTLWHFGDRSRSWLWVMGFGFSCGFALMVKQTAILFLIIPWLWAIAGTLWRRQWQRLAQLFVGSSASLLVFYPWYRTNWLLILTAGKRATIDSAIAEGDPALTTVDAWIYYLKILPFLLGLPLLVIPLSGGFWRGWRDRSWQLGWLQLRWLLVFLVGGYLLCSLNVNKDARYILPLLPILALFLARGILTWDERFAGIRWGTVGLAALLMMMNLFPFGGSFTRVLSPRVRHLPAIASEFPQPEIITEITTTDPYLQTTLGVLPSTPQINQHNFSFYGAIADFQVYGRQVGVRKQEVAADVAALDWFITKTGDPGSVPDAYHLIANQVETGGEFQLHRSWKLPDESSLKLYHRRQPNIIVRRGEKKSDRVDLKTITLPRSAPPGVPIPVTYTWIGGAQSLKLGLVLLTWRSESSGNIRDYWLHDRGLAMGRLSEATGDETLEIIEGTAMLPPADIAPGTYTLEALYLNRETGETAPIPTPSVTIEINATAPVPDAPELDLVTQLRTLGANLAQGEQALDFIFAETARINQYDPTFDYLEQAEIALSYRLQHQLPQRDWLYSLALANVLQRDVTGAIAALENVVRVDADNPYAYAYLAFVRLYNWQPIRARKALAPALAIAPQKPILRAIDGVAALMQGNLIRAWRQLSTLSDLADG